MPHKLTRREMLKLTAIGGLGSLVAACSPRSTPTAVAPAATRIPSTPTAASLLNPTSPPATVAPAATSAATAASTTAPAATLAVADATSAPALAGDMAAAANGFLAVLDDSRRAKATYAFDNAAERTRWHWTTPRGFPRNGLPLSEMTAEQRDQAMALLAAGLSPAGLQKALDIMALQNDLGNNPDLYYVTVFGTPGVEPWGWRYEGHHLSRHFTVAGGQVSETPLFLGAWPTVSANGLKAMEREEWAARELATAANSAGQTGVIFRPNTLTTHVTGNSAVVTPLDPVGLAFGELGADQQALLTEIIQRYLDTLPTYLAEAQLAGIEQGGVENIRFGWAGPLDAQRPYYYRVQGPSFLLEHDNSRGGGTHIHSVWRDFTGDFGGLYG